MSQENVEIVRSIYEEWGRGNFRASVTYYDPHIVFVERVAPDADRYVGLDGMAEHTRRWLQEWSDMTIEAEELIDAGESVVVAVDLKGVGSQSGARSEAHFFHVWTFRGGAVIRLDSVRDRQDAPEAVGLSE